MKRRSSSTVESERQRDYRLFQERQKEAKRRLAQEQSNELSQLRALHRSQLAAIRLRHSSQKTTLAQELAEERIERSLALARRQPKNRRDILLTPDLDFLGLLPQPKRPRQTVAFAAAAATAVTSDDPQSNNDDQNNDSTTTPKIPSSDARCQGVGALKRSLGSLNPSLVEASKRLKGILRGGEHSVESFNTHPTSLLTELDPVHIRANKNDDDDDSDDDYLKFEQLVRPGQQLKMTDFMHVAPLSSTPVATTSQVDPPPPCRHSPVLLDTSASSTVSTMSDEELVRVFFQQDSPVAQHAATCCLRDQHQDTDDDHFQDQHSQPNRQEHEIADINEMNQGMLQEPSQQRALASVNPVSTPPATQELANDDEPSNEAP